MILRGLFTLAVFAAWSCAAAAEPLRLDAFFKGRLTGTGEVDNYRDGTHRAFTATMQASWTGPHGALTEDLTYADGEKKRFIWTFDKIGDGRYVGHRDDLVRNAEVVEQDGAVRMTYVARTRVPSGRIWTLSFDDRLEQTSPTSVTLRGDVSYLFVGVGVTHMTMTKVGR